ncbi:Copper amine oxidase N-terminal domain-containing protein [Paenibacillus sp. UNCCL117]|uniref:copper amine oxidase N-terminal domain-containing protein n=1 Tax=unclassified Paenibacillus TaxID=185978 RepID=UPI000888EBA0|nr:MULTISPECIES: copper amine oxidase N-terminal domain-containing protein [unclassified Paenibacillus]SDC95797.1 Copper amine oxidase N-terminal domain-containing protein [Paenibacillus sp. cl123]SFW30150.1 Copper amine oxidase N-terminal domain-containing protein [Paenibacillus sp. UNCCL117]
MMRNKWKLAITCSLLMNSMSLGGGAFAADSASQGGVQIKEFVYLDKELDRISQVSASTPDGMRDGHLRLLMDAGEGLEIQSISLRTADSKGNETSQGIWKTWKAEAGDIGTLLAVVQDGKTINETFQEKLGKFQGIVEFELYASDNNGMKPGVYYYLEIMTSSGTIRTPIAPYAENETSYAPVAIREFSWLDLTSDRTGIAEFGEDGSTDGHFRLKLHFAQKTEVLAVILRATDEKGNEAPGIWRTNRAGVGWLLGIAQGDKVITPGFKKDVKEPVGSFQGSGVFDLYANNNGSIKNGQHYVVEVETTYGTVISKPVKFGDPASNYVDTSPLGFRSIVLTLDKTAALVDEEPHTLDVAPFTLEGRTMVPIRFIGEALGAKVDWDSAKRLVTLTKGDTKVELVIEQKEAYVGGELVMLDTPAIIRDGFTLVPVRFVSEGLKMKVFYNDGEILITDAKVREVK